MNFLLASCRRTKVFVASTAVAHLILTTDPTPSRSVAPTRRPRLAARVTVARTPPQHAVTTTDPTSSVRVTARPLPARPGLLPRVAQTAPLNLTAPPCPPIRSVASGLKRGAPPRPGRTLTARTGIPASTTAVAPPVKAGRAARRPSRPGSAVSLHAVIPSVTPSAAGVRSTVVKSRLGAKTAAPRATLARTWAADPMARPHAPTLVRAGLRRLAALVAFTRMPNPAEAIEPELNLAPHVVRPPAKRPQIGRVALARTPLVNGTRGLPSTNPAVVKAGRHRMPAAHVAITASPTGPSPALGQTRPTRAVLAAPVKAARRAAAIISDATAIPVPKPTTRSLVVPARTRPPSAGPRPATARGLLFTVQPAPHPLTIAAGRPPRRAPKQATSLGTAKAASGAIQPPRSKAVLTRPVLPPRRSGKATLTASPAGPKPIALPVLVGRGKRGASPGGDVLVASTAIVHLIAPPRALLVAPAKRIARPRPVALRQTGTPSPVLHGPAPRTLLVSAASWPKRRAPQPITITNPISWAVDGLAPDLPAAALAWLRLNPAIVTAFGEDLTASPPTVKFFGDYNFTPSTMPYLVYQEIFEGPGSYQSADAQGVVYGFPAGQFQVNIFAGGKRQGRQLAELVAAWLNDPPLTFADGVLLELRLDSIRAIPDGEPGPAGQVNCFHFALTFLYRVQRSLKFTT